MLQKNKLDEALGESIPWPRKTIIPILLLVSINQVFSSLTEISKSGLL